MSFLSSRSSACASLLSLISKRAVVMMGVESKSSINNSSLNRVMVKNFSSSTTYASLFQQNSSSSYLTPTTTTTTTTTTTSENAQIEEIQLPDINKVAVTKAKFLREMVQEIPKTSLTALNEEDEKFFDSISPTTTSEEKKLRKDTLEIVVEGFFEIGSPLKYKTEFDIQDRHIPLKQAKRIHKKIILNKEQELYGPPAPLLDLLNPNQAKAVITTICEAHGTTFATANAYLENDQNRKKFLVDCIEAFKKDIPNNVLYKLQTIKQITTFFSAPPPKETLPVFPNIDMSKLPPNLRIEV